jgi:hypothetical protein
LSLPESLPLVINNRLLIYFKAVGKTDVEEF